MTVQKWHLDTVLVVVATAVFVAILVPGLGRYGLWEPWEVATLESAATPDDATESEGRHIERREPVDRITARVTAWVLGEGMSEAGVRRPFALAGLASLLAALLLGAALFGWRPAVYGALVLSGLPLFLVTSRMLVGSPFPVLAFTLVTGGAALACFGPFRPAINAIVGVVTTAAGLLLGESCAGFFMGRFVPLAGAVLGLTFARPWELRRSVLSAWLVLVAGFVAMTAVDAAVQDLSVLTRATGGTEDFTEVIRRLLHGSFPWIGLVLAGLGTLFFPAELDDRPSRAATVLATSVAVCLVAQTAWSTTWRHMPFMALWPLCAGAGLLLHQSMIDGRPRRVVALVCGLMTLLGLRDLWLEPSVVLAPLSDASAQFPEGVDGKPFFAAVALVLGVPLVLAFFHGGDDGQRLPIRDWIRRYFAWLPVWRGRSRVVGGIVLAVPMLLLAHTVALAFSPPVLWFPLLSCMEWRAWMIAGAVVPATLLIALAGKLCWDLIWLVGKAKMLLVMAIGAGVTLATVHVVIPSLSRHFSSRSVVLAYERQREGDEPLLAYRASTSAVELLGSTEVEQVTTPEKLVQRLTGAQRVFALIKAEDLATIDVRYRTERGDHVPVVDDTSATTLLLSNAIDEGQPDLNPLARIVPRQRPRPRLGVHANFDDRIELLGIDIEGRGGSAAVCPASSFTLTFYWHCRRSVSGNQKVFVHIDGYGQRINGDHYPADDRYPVRHWREGDYIVDSQRLDVPAHFRPGDYTVYVGFFVGSTRLPVKEGAAGSDNRVRAGVLKVR
jgi:hypothetical protein